MSHLTPHEYVVVSDGSHIQVSLSSVSGVAYTPSRPDRCPVPQMPDGQIIQYEHDGAFLQEQQVRGVLGGERRRAAA